MLRHAQQDGAGFGVGCKLGLLPAGPRQLGWRLRLRHSAKLIEIILVGS